MPFMAELKNLIGNNPNQKILPSLLEKANDNTTKTLIDKQIGSNNAGKYLQNAIGALGDSKSRLMDTFTGYGPDRLKMMRSNMMDDLGELSDTALKKVNASMAARGLTGGVMSNAQNLAMKDIGRNAQRALSELNIADAEAERTDRWSKEGMLADNAQETASAWLQGGGQAEDMMARLLGLRGAADESALKAAGMYSDVAQRGFTNVLDAAKIGSQGMGMGLDLYKQGLDKYRIDNEAWSGLFSALGGNSAPQFQQPQPTVQRTEPNTASSYDLADLFSRPTYNGPDTFTFKYPTDTSSKYVNNANEEKKNASSKYFSDPGSRYFYTPGQYQLKR